MNLRRLPLYLCLLLLTQCSKCKDGPAPADQTSLLPPATQTGANTFGCLINGQAYTPEGRIGLGANFNISYDPTFQGGYLSVSTYRVLEQSHKLRLSLVCVPVAASGTYSLNLNGGMGGATYIDSRLSSPCDEVFRSSVSYRTGTLTITRLDVQARIISGTFDMKFVRAGCDTIRITQGRFDGRM